MNYHNISYPDMLNGEGLRVILWLSGCNHNCKNCQNPQTWNSDSGVLFDGVAEKELFEQLDKDYISGLTLTGGDPLHGSNLDEVLILVNKIRHLYGKMKTIWLYTGYTWDEALLVMKGIDEKSLKFNHDNKIRREIIEQCDVMVEGKFVQKFASVNYPYAGSTNQRIVDIEKTLKIGKIIEFKI